MWFRNPVAFRPAQVTFWTTIVYLAVVIPLLYVHETVPDAPHHPSPYRGLNLTEAWVDLQTITTKYHPYNSHDNDGVRKYLIDRSKEILEQNDIGYTLQPGITKKRDTPGADRVTLFDDQVANLTRTKKGAAWTKSSGLYFEGNNFYIYIRGRGDPEGDWWASKSSFDRLRGNGGVLVNCHFDSVSTGYGATDDGMGCVTLLQLLSYFTSRDSQPESGIVLLFNNGEEDGLLGARAFGQTPVWEFCHTFVNLEGAGAGGRAMLFRTSDLETAKAYSSSPHPFGSVVAANAFEKGAIKSGTDYEVFTEYYGQRGLDIAFYAPRSRYHTDQDDARHASVNSIWHMLSAALETTAQLAQDTGTVFNGERGDKAKNKVWNGKPTRGVWFDLFGSAWATMALRGLFAWSLTLLVATPLILLVVSYLLVRKDKYYFFARDIGVHSEVDDGPVRIGGWKGFFRFPLALLFAGALTIASVLLLAKFNPLIIYSSAYAVWAMTISLFYFAFWLVMRGSSFVRPSALHRGFAHIWLFIIGWGIQVLAAVAEDRMKIGAAYFAAFLQTAVFASLLVSLLEMFALPGKRDFARQFHDAHDVGDAHESAGTDDNSRAAQPADSAQDDDPGTPTETTPLRAGEQGYGANNQTTFASTYRRSVAAAAAAPSSNTVPRAQPYDGEQSWSGRLPQSTWLIQFLLLAPVPLMLIGNLALVATSSLGMTGTDGSSLLMPLLSIGYITVFLLLPLTPFMHRVTHHIPVFLLFVFVGTFIYNLSAFPFSIGSRFKFFFKQDIDLDKGTNVVHLTGLENFVRPVISSLPSAIDQTIECHNSTKRPTLSECGYDASSLSPTLVEGKELDELISVTVPESDDSSATLTINALDTRLCVLKTSRPIFGFSVAGGSPRDERFGDLPAEGFTDIDIWRRTWEGAWNVTLDLKKSQRADHDGSDIGDEGADINADPLEVQVGCKWSDANKPSTIPAFHEILQFMPSWATVTKADSGLVEVKKRYKIGG